MVCLGNICRSPMAQGILEHVVAQHDQDWHIDSAGTSGWHNGELPDSRAIHTCKAHGIDITNQRSRKLRVDDFQEFDLILAMDESNLENIHSVAAKTEHSCRIEPIVSFAGLGDREVPDPYFDGRFEEVYDLLWDACAKIAAMPKPA